MSSFGEAEGRVVAYDSHAGRGEVETADGRRYPFHCAEIADGSREIDEGAAVTFEVAPGLLGRWEARRLRQH